MTKDEARELFSAALEGELDPARTRELHAAFDADPELAREYAEFTAILRVVRDVPGAEPVPDLLPGVQRRLRARSRGRFYRDRFAERSGIGKRWPLSLVYTMLVALALAAVLLQVLQWTTLAH